MLPRKWGGQVLLSSEWMELSETERHFVPLLLKPKTGIPTLLFYITMNMEENFSDLSVGLANRCRQKGYWWFRVNSCWETYCSGKVKTTNNGKWGIFFILCNENHETFRKQHGQCWLLLIKDATKTSVYNSNEAQRIFDAYKPRLILDLAMSNADVVPIIMNFLKCH